MGDVFNLDDLDAQLFGRKTTSQAGATAAAKPSLSNMDSLLGGLSESRPARRTAVTFMDDAAAAGGGAEQAKSKWSVDDLFKDPPLPQRSGGGAASGGGGGGAAPRSTSGGGRAADRSYGASSASSGFDALPTRRDPEPARTAVAPAMAPAPVAAPVVISSAGEEVAARAQRMEQEVERLNREIVDVRRQKKEDESELEKEWREKLAKRDAEHAGELEATRATLLRQIEKLKEEHAEEVARMKTTYARQLEAMQTTTAQSRDVTGVVDKVDELAERMSRLVSEASATSERVFLEKESTLKLSEQQLAMRQDMLETEKQRLAEERTMVYDLNIKLRDLVKEQEAFMENEKWRTKEEWNRLAAEKEIFKTDQKFILDGIDKQKRELEASRAAFFREQHDLLVRVSQERASLDQERADFRSARGADVRRLRDEASALHTRASAVRAAEAHVSEAKRLYQNKFKQLQELESALMDECVEMERIRAATGAKKPSAEAIGPDDSLLRDYARESGSFPPEYRDASTSDDKPSEIDDKPDDSIRDVLRKHSEFLDKYIGQKVAAVAPQYPSSNRH